MDNFTKKIFIFFKSFISDPLSHWPFTKLSLIIFGNSAGVRQNIFGCAHKYYYKYFNEKHISNDPEVINIVNKINDHGLYKVSDYISKDLITDIHESFVEINNKKNHKNDYLFTLLANDVSILIPKVFNIFNENITNILKTYFNSDFVIDDVLIRRNSHPPEDVVSKGEAYSDEWHCDSAPTSELGMFILLHDTTDKQGPTLAINKPESKTLVRKYYRSRNSVDSIRGKLENASSKIAFTGKMGDVLFIETTKCLHRASLVDSGHHRDMIMVRLFPTNTNLNKNIITKSPIYRYTHGNKK